MHASESFVLSTQWDPFFGPPVPLGKGGHGWKNDPDPRSGIAQQRVQNPIAAQQQQQQFAQPHRVQPMMNGFEQHPSYVPSPYRPEAQQLTPVHPQLPMNTGMMYSPPYPQQPNTQQRYAQVQPYQSPYPQQQAQPYQTQPYGGTPVGTSQGAGVNFNGAQPYAAPLPAEAHGSANAPNVLAYPQLQGQAPPREELGVTADALRPYGVPLKGANGSSGRSRKSQGDDSQSVDTELSDKGAAVEVDKLL